MRRALVLAVAAVALLSGCASSDSSTSTRLPDAVLASFSEGGEPLDLSRLEGPAVINLWASNCGPCRREMPLYQSFAQRHRGQVEVIGVDFREVNRERAAGLVRATGVTYPLYSDPDGRLRSNVLPELILVDQEGHVAHREYVEITSVRQLDDLVEKHLGVLS